MMKRWMVLSLAGPAILALAIFVAAAQYGDYARAEAERALDARAQLVSESLDRTLKLRTVEAFTFSALPSLRGFAASDAAARPARLAVANTELQAMVAADPNLGAASIVDRAGRVILTTDALMNADWSARVFVREALAGHLYASVPSRDFGAVVQYYSAPILDNGGNVAAALILRVTAQEFWDALDGQPNVLVVDDHGVRIADRSNAPQLFVALIPPAFETLSGLMAEHYYGAEITQLRASNLPELADRIESKQTTAIYRETGGQTIHAALRPMQTAPWTIVVFDSEEAMADQARGAFWEAIKLPALGLLVGWGFLLAAGWVLAASARPTS